MINEFAIQIEIQQHDRELTERIEQRRIATERAAEERGVSRLAVMARRARLARVSRSAAGTPLSC
ncbi:hypothetical protein [Aeromicrobium sp. P5_D10]